MNYEKAWTTLNDIISTEWSRKHSMFSMLNKSETVSVADDLSTIRAQVEILHFIDTIMTSIASYARGCDEACLGTVDREEGEECVD